jgi:hypothetical protein
VLEGALSAEVEEATPDFADVVEIFEVLRAYRMATGMAPIFDENRHRIKQSVIWNVEQGRSFTAVGVGIAEQKQAAFYQRMLAFLDEYEFLLCPFNQVPPFDVEIDYPTEINGVEMENYIAWMKSAYWISATGLPSISVPAGFTSDGLPVGLQVVGRPRVRLTYSGRGRSTSERVVDPLGLVDKDDVWYLMAGTAKGRRTFRVDRIVAAEVTDEPAGRPDDFELEAAWDEVVEEMEGRRSRTWATVLVEQRFLPVMQDRFGRHCHTEELLDDGRARVRVGAPLPLDRAGGQLAEVHRALPPRDARGAGERGVEAGGAVAASGWAARRDRPPW